MTRDKIIQAFDGMRVWQRGDQRAVHKPLLVLYALAKIGAGGGAAMTDWNDDEPKLKELLDEFGPNGSGNTRHLPFWHLKTDGLWQLDGPAGILNRPPSATPTLTELRDNHVRGGFPPGKRFNRNSYDATLNPHKNKSGWECIGRIGLYMGTR